MTAQLDADSAEDQARRVYFAAVARLAERVPSSKFPFLRDYQVDLATLGADSLVRRPEPVRCTGWRQATGFELPELVDLFTVALVDEDARFGAVFEASTGHPRPTLGLLHAWWPQSRPTLRRLRELGLLDGRAGGGARRPTSACACRRWCGTRCAATRPGLGSAAAPARVGGAGRSTS